MAGLLTLIRTNIATRVLRMPTYWIDKASILTMVRLGFIGASALILRASISR